MEGVREEWRKIETKNEIKRQEGRKRWK